ncbi:unnamed protein product [Oikopleura dioica]|uniref:Uncharacterized protein n=1 Tax=Oikopleura dioica TaxID=34765 RepID=E4Y4Y9_OIKDI|nr:unnamed protein product [Oikopleura dioica]
MYNGGDDLSSCKRRAWSKSDDEHWTIFDVFLDETVAGWLLRGHRRAGMEGSGENVDYTLDENRGDYEYDEFGNKKKKNQKNQASYSPPVYSPPSYDSSYSSGYNYGGYGKTYAAATYAYALNCWPANFDTDKLVHADNPGNTDPYEVFSTGPLHYYGSEMKSLKNDGTAAAAPAAAANNRGGLYHYGWENDESVVSGTAAGDYKVNALPSQWVHYHSARHAGCLYELAGFDYSSTTYDHVYEARYYNGYFDTTFTTTLVSTPALTDGTVYVPNWVHFFNAHLLVGGAISQSTIPVVENGYSSSAASTINANVVIANPQYEGLGFLNFIATYKVNGKATGEHYQEFIDMTKRTSDTLGNYDTYNAINKAANTQHTDGVGGEWFFDGWMGTWTFNLASTEWHSTYVADTASAGTWTGNFAISSFPHNELGKDFRFNLRILTKASTDLEIPESYYWYKVNTIEITFPHAVAYALHNDYKRLSSVTSTFTASTAVTTDPANTSRSNQMMNVVNAEERVNIIPPLDIGTWDDVSFLRAEDWVRGSETNGIKFNRINGYLHTLPPSADAAANWCSATGDAADEDFCATKFKIEGLMNTYDEHFAAQKGNIQEIWIQLSYAMRNTAIADTNALEAYNVDSPFPYLHFHATEITSIVATCSTLNVENGNDCEKYSVAARHKGAGPYGG